MRPPDPAVSASPSPIRSPGNRVVQGVLLGGGYWATALGLTGWGLAVVYIGDARPPDIDTAGAYLAGAGLAGVVAAVLRRRGFLISDLGFAATVALGGVTLALTPRASGTLDDATTYAIALGVVGVLNVAGGVYQMVRGGRFPPAQT